MIRIDLQSVLEDPTPAELRRCSTAAHRTMNPTLLCVEGQLAVLAVSGM
jgi:hypothetical protein